MSRVARSRGRFATLAIAASVVASGALATGAGASFHLMKISEVHFDNTADDDFVELQMLTDGQNLVGGHFVRIYNGTGGTQGTFTIPSSVANGQSQRTILIGNSSLSGADFNSNVIEPDLDGGAACFLDSLGVPDVGTQDVGIDCVAWGNFDGSFTDGTPSPVGSNVAPGGLSDDQSLTRLISPGCATLLEDADDTGNSITDFAITGSTPRSNSVVPTEKSCTPAPPPPQKKAKKCKKKGKGKGAASAKKCKKKKKKGK